MLILADFGACRGCGGVYVGRVEGSVWACCRVFVWAYRVVLLGYVESGENSPTKGINNDSVKITYAHWHNNHHNVHRRI